MEANMNPTHAYRYRNRNSRIQFGGREVKIKAKWNDVLSVKFTFLFPSNISIWLCRNYKIKAPSGPMVKVTKSRLGNASFSENMLDTLI